MDDLTAFVAARLDEDEAAAKAATEESGQWFEPGLGAGEWSVRNANAIVECRTGVIAFDEGCPTDAQAVHIARHDPARVLREVEAGRALLRMHEPVPFWGNNPPLLKDRTPENAVAWYCECQCPDGVIQGAYPCDTARLIAAVYSDHPDYDQEWKP